MQQQQENFIRQQIVDKTRQCLELASQHFGRPFAMPAVSFNQRGKIAGSARLQLNQLRFNPVLMQDNEQHFIEEVVPHEVCHLLVYQLYGRVRPHGREWQSLMKTLYKIPAKTCHTMDVSKVRGQTFLYRCQCGPVELSIRRHNKVQQRQQQYSCRKCGDRLVSAERFKTSAW